MQCPCKTDTGVLHLDSNIEGLTSSACWELEKFHCRFLSDFAVEWKSGRREKGNAVPMSKRHGRT